MTNSSQVLIAHEERLLWEDHLDLLYDDEIEDLYSRPLDDDEDEPLIEEVLPAELEDEPIYEDEEEEELDPFFDEDVYDLPPEYLEEEPFTDEQLREIEAYSRLLRRLRPRPRPWTFAYYRAPRALRARIEELFDETFHFDEIVRQGALPLFVHLYLSTLYARDGWHAKTETWVPADAKFVSDTFGRANRKKKVGKAIVSAMEKAGYLRVSGYSSEAEKCRAYSIDRTLMLELVTLAVEHALDDEWVNLVTGRKTNLKNREERIFKEPKDAPKKKGGRPVLADRFALNWKAGQEAVLARLRLADAVGSPSERRSLYTAARSLLAIRSAPSFRWSRKTKGHGSYVPRYTDKTRLYEEGGRFQTCPQWLKGALVEGTEAKNYDIPSRNLSMI